MPVKTDSELVCQKHSHSDAGGWDNALANVGLMLPGSVNYRQAVFLK